MTDSDEVKLLPCEDERLVEAIARALCEYNFRTHGCEGKFGTVDDCWFAFTDEARAAVSRPPVVTDEVVEPPPCPTCEGRGVYDSHPIPPDKGPAIEFECYACNGTGIAALTKDSTSG